MQADRSCDPYQTYKFKVRMRMLRTIPDAGPRSPGHSGQSSGHLSVVRQVDRVQGVEVKVANLFIYQARESSLVPVGFRTAQFSAETVIYEAFVLIGELGWWFTSFLSWRKGKVYRSSEG